MVGKKHQSIPRLLDFSMRSYCFIVSTANRNSFSPAVRFVPLLLYMIFGLPRRAMNRHTASTNEWTLKGVGDLDVHCTGRQTVE